MEFYLDFSENVRNKKRDLEKKLILNFTKSTKFRSSKAKIFLS